MPQYSAKQKDDLLNYINEGKPPLETKEYKEVAAILMMDGYATCVAVQGSIKERVLLTPIGIGFLADGGYTKIEEKEKAERELRERELAINEKAADAATRSASAAEKSAVSADKANDIANISNKKSTRANYIAIAAIVATILVGLFSLCHKQTQNIYITIPSDTATVKDTAKAITADTVKKMNNAPEPE